MTLKKDILFYLILTPQVVISVWVLFFYGTSVFYFMFVIYYADWGGFIELQ